MTAGLRVVILFLVLTLVSGSPAAGNQIPGRVLRVIDGDSLVLDVRGGLYQIDLAGIDAPELNQPWGHTAGDHLRRLLGGAFVVVDTQATRGSQLLGAIRFKDRDIGLQLIDAGLAWSLYSKEPDRGGPIATPHPYALAEREARDARRGLWSDDDPIPPWQWRRPDRLGTPQARE